MRQDWIEFNMKGDRLLSLRPKYIMKYSMTQEGSPNTTIVMYKEGDFTKDYYVAEPYEQVKQKIMDAEKVDFTKEEYKHLLRLCENATQPNDGYTPDWTKLNPIMNKLNEILKEKE